MLKLFFPAGVLFLMAISFASCQKEDPTDNEPPVENAMFGLTVFKDSVDFVTQDTITGPVAQAAVRIYFDQIDTTSVDSMLYTNAEGRVVFVWPQDVILQYDITYGSYSSLENFVILQIGDTIERTVNINN